VHSLRHPSPGTSTSDNSSVESQVRRSSEVDLPVAECNRGTQDGHGIRELNRVAWDCGPPPFSKNRISGVCPATLSVYVCASECDLPFLKAQMTQDDSRPILLQMEKSAPQFNEAPSILGIPPVPKIHRTDRRRNLQSEH